MLSLTAGQWHKDGRKYQPIHWYQAPIIQNELGSRLPSDHIRQDLQLKLFLLVEMTFIVCVVCV